MEVKEDSFNASPFIVTKDHNGKVFAYFYVQWGAIKNYEAKKAQSIKNPKGGEYCRYFTVFDKSLDLWTWVG